MGFTRYHGDPYMITAKYRGSCAACGAGVRPGQRAYYWPRERRIYCAPCGEPLYREFVAMAEDEEFYHSR